MSGRRYCCSASFWTRLAVSTMSAARIRRPASVSARVADGAPRVLRGIRPPRRAWPRGARATGRGQPGRASGRGARADGGGQSENQRRHTSDGREGAGSDRGRAARGPLSRRAVPDQGPGHGVRRRADAKRIAAAPRLHPAPGRGTGRQVQERGSRDLRQDEHARARDGQRYRARALRPDPQPLESRSDPRWLVGRIRSSRGGGHRAGRGRERRRRFDPHARLELRPGRSQAQPRAKSFGPASARALVGFCRRACGDTHRARQRGAARRDPRALCRSAHAAAGAGATVPRGDTA